LVIGVRNNPPVDANEDPRVKEFVEEYYRPVREGAGLILGERLDNGDMRDVVTKIKELPSDHVYVSVDIDVGSGEAFNCARVQGGYKGLSERNLILMIRMMKRWLDKRGKKICGMDIMEIDTYGSNFARGSFTLFPKEMDIIRTDTHGANALSGERNRVYDLCASVIELLFSAGQPQKG
jgi:hypothetical protein